MFSGLDDFLEYIPHTHSSELNIDSTKWEPKTRGTLQPRVKSSC